MTAENLIWLWNGLKPDPFGVIPLSNISGKTSVTSIKNYELVASYNWLMEPYTDVENPNPTMIVPGFPKLMLYWNGGKLALDEGYMIYDANHLRYPIGPMDPLFQAVRLVNKKLNKPEPDFQQYDLITDCVNLQKIFAFCKGDEEGGMFRIDLERVGQTVIASRVEGSDVVAIDFDSYDQNLRSVCSRPLNSAVEGPFQQMASYQFGQVKLLVRFDSDCADFTKSSELGQPNKVLTDTDATTDPFSEPAPSLENRVLLPESKFLRFIDHGYVRKYSHVTMASFPHGKGFPAFTWAQLFFSGIDTLMIGWWKGKNEFTKPTYYSLAEASKMIKPLPYSALSKVHDFLLKILAFMRKNDTDTRVSILWKGGDFIELYEKSPQMDGIVTADLKAFLNSQVRDEQSGNAAE